MTERERYKSLTRLVGVLGPLLRGERIARADLERRWRVSRVTVDRHVERLLELPGVQCSDQDGREVLFFDPAQVVDPPSFPLVVASCFGSGLASLFVGSAYSQTMRDAVTHLVRQSRRRGAFKDISRKFLYVAQGGETALPDGSGALDELVDAVLHCKYVSFEYEHFDGRRDQPQIQPLSIAVYQHQIYVIGRNDEHQAYPYRLARISDLVVEDDRFKYPLRGSYDPEHVFRDAIGIFITDGRPLWEVTIRLQPKWRVHVRTHRWHKSQQATDQHDGSILVRLNVRDCPELEMLILSFGEDAEVLSPPELRERVAARAARLAKVYEREPAPLARARPRAARGESTSGQKKR